MFQIGEQSSLSHQTIDQALLHGTGLIVGLVLSSRCRRLNRAERREGLGGFDRHIHIAEFPVVDVTEERDWSMTPRASAFLLPLPESTDSDQFSYLQVFVVDHPQIRLGTGDEIRGKDPHGLRVD